MKKFTKEQIEVLKGFWKDVEVAGDKYWESIQFIEEQAKHILDIDIEVFHVDGDPVGFGDVMRKYGLLRRNEKHKWVHSDDESFDLSIHDEDAYE